MIPVFVSTPRKEGQCRFASARELAPAPRFAFGQRDSYCKSLRGYRQRLRESCPADAAVDS